MQLTSIILSNSSIAHRTLSDYYLKSRLGFYLLVSDEFSKGVFKKLAKVKLPQDLFPRANYLRVGSHDPFLLSIYFSVIVSVHRNIGSQK